MAGWARRHLLGLDGVDAPSLRALLSATDGFARGKREGDRPLDGRLVANLFFEDSTRTRLSFSIAAQRLGAGVVDLTSAGSSVSKGESIEDTALTVASMGADALIVRHRAGGAPVLIARALQAAIDGNAQGDGVAGPMGGAGGVSRWGGRAQVSVINAGDGRHEHPTQALLDAYTIADALGRTDGFDLSGVTVAIVGDVLSSRVARSNIFGLTTLGARVVCVGPQHLAPESLATLGAPPGSCEVSHDFDDVVPDADVVMMLRIQFERHGEAKAGGEATTGVRGVPPPKAGLIPDLAAYRAGYALSGERAGRMRAGSFVMHPGPMNRGIEIDPEVADSGRSLVLRQVSHGVHARMAALEACLASHGA